MPSLKPSPKSQKYAKSYTYCVVSKFHIHQHVSVIPEGFKDVRGLGDFERSASQPGGPEFRGGTNIQENAPIGPEGLNARMKREYLERKRLRDQAAPDRSQYFPGADSGDGSYKPEPYNRYKDGMMSLEPLDFSNDLLSPEQRQGVRGLGHIG